MQSSPLRLEWVSYPAASFRALFAESAESVGVGIAATVTYCLDGIHSIELKLASLDVATPNAAYSFSIEAVAGFSFDLVRARAIYRCESKALPQVIAVNIARIVYAGARELLATFTARAPHGSVLIESVMIGPEDLTIRSVEEQDRVLVELFGIEMDLPKQKTRVRTPVKAPTRAGAVRNANAKATAPNASIRTDKHTTKRPVER